MAGKRKSTKQKNAELGLTGKKLRLYGLKLRAYPTPYQQETMIQFMDAHRFTYNFYLGERKEVYELTKETLQVNEFKKAFNQLKDHPHFEWLKKADKFALETGIEQVDDAFKRFFDKQAKFPRFKSKRHAKQSYSTKETNNNIAFDIEKQQVKLPKIGWVRVLFSKKQQRQFKEDGFRGKVKGATVSAHSSGQIHISLKIEEIIDLPPEVAWQNIDESEVIGVDLGLLHFLIDSNGLKIENPRTLQKKLVQLKCLQQRLSRKQKGSANFKKVKQALAKLYLQIANIRKDFLHKVSRKLINENQVIVLEDLHVKNMLKNKNLARSISDVGWGNFVIYLQYKAEWANKKVIHVGRFFASTKLCSGCGEKNTALTLSEREWVCGECGRAHDRDENAAINIKAEGLRLLREGIN